MVSIRLVRNWWILALYVAEIQHHPSFQNISIKSLRLYHKVMPTAIKRKRWFIIETEQLPE